MTTPEEVPPLQLDGVPPWYRWRRMSRHGRAIKFAQTYCRTPKGHRPNQPLVLTTAQKEWFEEILSDDVTQAVKSCPRGEGKSTEAAALGLWNVFDEPEFGDPNVPIIATRVSQAMSSIYDVAVRMIELEPELAGRSKVYSGMPTPRIQVPLTHGKMFPKANGIAGLQGLDYSLAIMDEIGFQPLDAWQAVVLAQGKRPWSLAVGTGTPGFNLDPDNALWHVRQRVIESNGGIPGLSYTEVAAAPNCAVDDEDELLRANPSVAAGFKSLQSLRNNRATMTETAFRTFHLGQWVEGAECWLGDGALKTWRALVDPYDLTTRPERLVPNENDAHVPRNPKRGAPTWVGVDVGFRHDSTAVVWGQRRPDGRLHARCKIWTVKTGQTTDVDAIMEFIRELYYELNVVEVAYDPAFFQLPAMHLANEGLPMLETPQSLQRMAPAFADLLRVIKSGQLSVERDKDLETHVMNGRARHVQRGFTLYKLNPSVKIDACYALALMHDRAKHVVKEKPKLTIAR